MLDRPVGDPFNIKMESQKGNLSDKDEPELKCEPDSWKDTQDH